MSEADLVWVASARPDGGTTVAGGVAAARKNSLFVDLNQERPELATRLDVPGSPSIFDLAGAPRLSPLTRAELEDHVHWRDGIGILAGAQRSGRARELPGSFLDSLLAVAGRSFDQVVVDAGRLRPQMPAPPERATVLVVARPTALGLSALETALQALIDAGSPWRHRIKVALNRVRDDSVRGADEMLAGYYGVEVIAHLPDTPTYWEAAERECSLRALRVPIPDRKRFVRTYGQEALRAREALMRLTLSLAASRPEEARTNA